MCLCATSYTTSKNTKYSLCSWTSHLKMSVCESESAMFVCWFGLSMLTRRFNSNIAIAVTAYQPVGRSLIVTPIANGNFRIEQSTDRPIISVVLDQSLWSHSFILFERVSSLWNICRNDEIDSAFTYFGFSLGVLLRSLWTHRCG